MAEKVQRKTPKPARKRRWQPPKVKSGQLFESNSLACGKVFSTGNEDCLASGTPQSS
jgi:uncharacterized OB-fold protein